MQCCAVCCKPVLQVILDFAVMFQKRTELILLMSSFLPSYIYIYTELIKYHLGLCPSNPSCVDNCALCAYYIVLLSHNKHPKCECTLCSG